MSDYEALREAAEKRLQSEWTDEDGDVWIPPEELPRAVHALFEAVGLVALLDRLEAAERVVEAAAFYRSAALCGETVTGDEYAIALATFRSLEQMAEGVKRGRDALAGGSDAIAAYLLDDPIEGQDFDYGRTWGI